MAINILHISDLHFGHLLAPEVVEGLLRSSPRRGRAVQPGNLDAGDSDL